MTADARASRRAAVGAGLEERKLDALLVTHLPNIRYLTGFTGTAAVLAVLRDAAVIFTDFRYETQIRDEVDAGVRTEIVSTDQWKRVWSVLVEHRATRVGFESGHVTAAERERIAHDAGRATLEPTAGLVEALRAAKDDGEIAAIRAAAQLCGEALRATLDTVQVGQTERAIAARLEFELRQRGSEWHPFQTIVASGPRSALPHARTSDRPLGRGEWLLVDFGAQVDGYCADMTRTMVVGAPASERQRAAYGVVRDAQTVAIQGLRSGISGREGDALARDVIVDRGFGEAFGHSLGHGLGLEVHEEPRLSRVNESPLPDRAVVTVEPGVYIPGWGGVRIEDDVLLTPDGATVLSDGNTELEELD